MGRDRRMFALGGLVMLAAAAAGCGGGGLSSSIPPISNQGGGQVSLGSTPPPQTGVPVPTLKPSGTPIPVPSGAVSSTPRASSAPSSVPTTSAPPTAPATAAATSTPVATPKPTPSPTPTPTATPVPMQATAQMLSRAYPNNAGLPGLPAFQPQTDAGGNGVTIDGYTPANWISYGYHRNVVLAILNNGQLLQLPLAIGLIQPSINPCQAGPGQGNPYANGNFEAYQMHNHDHSGIWHLEPHSDLETFKLGSLFDIWGNQPITRTQVANQSGPVRIFSYNAGDNPPVATEWMGNPYDALFGTRMNDVTVIEIGTFVPLPRYTIDLNYENFGC